MGARAQDATTFMRKLRPVTEPKGALLLLLEHYERAVGVEGGVGVIESPAANCPVAPCLSSYSVS